MAYTHEYKLEIGDYTFKGDVEISNAGVVAYEETSNELMPKKTEDAVKLVLDTLGILPESYDELKNFKLSIKEEE